MPLEGIFEDAPVRMLDGTVHDISQSVGDDLRSTRQFDIPRDLFLSLIAIDRLQIACPSPNNRTSSPLVICRLLLIVHTISFWPSLLPPTHSIPHSLYVSPEIK